MYGLGAKYNTMEHKFRAWRKLAETLRATAGEGGPQVQPQTTPSTPRTPSTRGKTATPASKKSITTPKGKVAKDADGGKTGDTADTEAVVDISSDEETPTKVKRELKQESKVSSSPLSMKSHRISNNDVDNEVQITEEPAAKRVKLEDDSDDLLARLLSFNPDNEPHNDSKKNGYELEPPSFPISAEEANDNLIASLEELLSGSGAAFDPTFGSEA
ncbi:hypothetical protein PMG11_02870 [Penicillium brasilianum]|uniref:Uncharacterized protein n=1 Tax=Penicillium brasilianum TaxID=104259 RepID=A0A0F7TJA1_PENBI|nr:hypothetical protein PMG11_02870 [Penicillium brasilianum]